MGTNYNEPPYLGSTYEESIKSSPKHFKCINNEHIQIFLIIVLQHGVLYLYSIYIVLVIEVN